ncbi:MAG: phenol hydroxylase, partial [Thauera sp.]|nr:phenol hydroxylase [Thauera sp.]
MKEKAPDLSKKYVRLVERRADGMVEFEFSLADPDLYVEMLLP